MNVRSASLVYRAPYLYIAQSAEQSRVMRIGSTMRPVVELRRMQQRYAAPVQWLCGVRALAVLAPILWARFSYCRAGGQWFHPDRRLQQLIDQLCARDAESLLSADHLRDVFTAVFPESPYVGITAYRCSETYIRRCRTNTDSKRDHGTVKSPHADIHPRTAFAGKAPLGSVGPVSRSAQGLHPNGEAPANTSPARASKRTAT